ncbi:uncharacterized protein EI97DRAFT_429293 [Westerdykella ornata]|uniref:Uncharacterized protein n=1 Tax=Westerdykella ornata TaxID=318751 RepID=A0A6A6JXW3_WESOR|nr:uncharacterized protein EI97DRAFT_429293 [Westerdykella ornata]KAF2281247.1 hypothetical protein EI97DRAFT_429293 [Westerdykella ornata]
MSSAGEASRSNAPALNAVLQFLKEKIDPLDAYHSTADSKIRALQELVEQLSDASSVIDVQAIEIEGHELVAAYESNQKDWKAEIDNFDPEPVIEFLKSAGIVEQRARPWMERQCGDIRRDYTDYEEDFGVELVKKWFRMHISIRKRMIQNRISGDDEGPTMRRPLAVLWEDTEQLGENGEQGREI